MVCVEQCREIRGTGKRRDADKNRKNADKKDCIKNDILCIILSTCETRKLQTTKHLHSPKNRMDHRMVKWDGWFH